METNKFDINSFISPPVSYAPVYVWVWNDICTCEIIDAQLAEMQNMGIRAFYILPEPKDFRPDSMPTKLTPEYLSEEFFELCTYAVEKAKDLGMNCWFYDEGGWPSGGACGRVLKEHPEYAQQILKAFEYDFSAGETYKKSNADAIACFLNDEQIIEEGYTFFEDAVVTEYTIEKVSLKSTDYPDLLNKAATEHFIEITHEKYAKALKGHMGETVTAVFTDEPKAPLDAFSKELADKYEAAYGESIVPYVPLLAGRKAPTEKNAYILYRWYDLCSRAFCDSFLLPCKRWANKNGIAFTGHMDKDHDPRGCINGGGNFNLMRALRCFDIPGIDIIWRQLYPEKKAENKNEMNGYNGFFPRYASSAAAQNGTKLAVSEILGVAGAGVTYATMRYTVGYQAVRGINIFNPFNFPLGRKGALLAQELPVFTQQQPFCRGLSQFNSYIERLSYVSTIGERVYDTGLYYPVGSFQSGLRAESVSNAFDSLGRALEDMTVDFDIVDDDVIQAAKVIAEGGLCIGNAKYRNIIIPEGAFIPDATQKALDCFVKSGGTVSRKPSNLTPVVGVEGGGLRAMHRKTENADLFFLFREEGEAEEYLIHLPSSNGYLLNLESGALQSFTAENNVLKLSLEVGETAVVLLTDEPLNAQVKKEFTNCIEVSGDFAFCKAAELTCNENGFYNINHNAKPIYTGLGDWSALIGSAYSGSCVYTTDFDVPDNMVDKEGVLDLGNVRYIAQVYLNNQPLGTVLAPPYRFNIPAGVLGKSNVLKIAVTNTSANWYTHTDYFNKFKIEELSPYFQVELDFAKDLVSGGLYGPVTLCIEG